jgi:predicted amidophosphoribosyltransferase
MIKEVGKKQYGKQSVYFGIFECPDCKKHIERPKSNGKKQERCKECALEIKHKKLSSKMKRHGGKGTRLYRIWSGMKDRCLNKNSKDYVKYGNRGIEIYPLWIESF